MKILIKNQQRRIKISPERITKSLKKALQLLKLQKAELSILLVNDTRMRALNRQYRGIDRTTDVLSFPQQSAEVTSELPNFRPSELLLGDIVINLHKAKRQAIENGLTLNEELKKLLTHGLLHLMGFDHEKSRNHEKKMRRKERELLSKIS